MMTEERRKEIEEVTNGATSEPWVWIANKYSIDLISPPHGRCIVMDFVRRGMQGAQPRFSDRKGEPLGGIMRTADEIGDLNRNPDAKFMSLARSAIPELLEEIERLEAEVEKTANDRDEWMRRAKQFADTCRILESLVPDEQREDL